MSAVAVRRRLQALLCSIEENPRWAWAALAVLLLAGGLALYLAGRGVTFRRDEWNMILTRREHSLEVLLREHNKHLLPVHVLAYKGLLETFGLRTYTPYQTVTVVLHLTTVALLFAMARRRLGTVAALLIAVLFLFPGRAVHDVLWGFQFGYLAAMVAGLGAFFTLERHSWRGDLATCALLLIAIGSSGVGIAFALAAFVEVVAGDDRARRLVRVLGLPCVLYGAWLLAYAGEVPAGLEVATEPPGIEESPLKNLFDAPRFAASAAGTALSTTLGLDELFGPTLVVIAAGLIAMRVIRGPTPSPRMWAVLALAIGFWVLLGLARGAGNETTLVHHLYPGVAFVLLILAEWVDRLRLSGRVVTAIALAVAVILVSDLGRLRQERGGFLGETSVILPSLTALELARPVVDPSFRPLPESGGAAPDVVAGAYFAAVDDFGSPAPAPEELEAAPDFERVAADQVSVRALGVKPRPAPGAPVGTTPPAIVGTVDGQATTVKGCVEFAPASAPASVELRVPTGGLLLEPGAGAPLAAQARRLADTFGVPFAGVPGGQTSELRFPPDRLERPWVLRLEANQRVRACTLAPQPTP